MCVFLVLSLCVFLFVFFSCLCFLKREKEGREVWRKGMCKRSGRRLKRGNGDKNIVYKKFFSTRKKEILPLEVMFLGAGACGKVFDQ